MQGVLEPEFIALLQSFIHPKWMIQTPEPEPIIDETADRLAFVGGQVVPVERKGNLSDPIYELFNPPKTTNPGWTIISTPSLYTCVTRGVHFSLAVFSFSFSFCLRPDTNTDASDTQLCHAMANMVAVVLALEPRSNHIWYHMFAADALLDTYVMGFMVSSY